MISLKNTLKLMAKMVSPVGTVQAFAGATVPSGWLLCNGQAVSRTTYAKLYSVIGTIYGTGDGSTTFNLPNLQGRVPVGVSSSDGDFDLADTGGSKAMKYYKFQIGRYTNTEASGYGAAKSAYFRDRLFIGGPTITIGSTNNQLDATKANMPPYIALNYIICVG